MKIVIATRNKGKYRELQELLRPIGVDLLWLENFPGFPGVREDGESFLDNALMKAREVCALTGEVSLADDSGLEVEALGGRPGVLSARFAGEGSTDCDNNRRLLQEMRGIPRRRRKARFRCVIAVVSPDGKELCVEGRCDGEIALEKRGSGGFGYDPLFIPEGYSRTFAELGEEIKNRISHRARALARLRESLAEWVP